VSTHPTHASLVELLSVTEATRAPDRAAEILLQPPPHTDAEAPPQWWELEGWTTPHPCYNWHWHNDDGRRSPFRCRSWKCPRCAWSKARTWLELLDYAPIERHIVITRLDPDPKAAHARTKNIVKAIRRGEAVELTPHGRRRPRAFEYLATMERHSRAGIHTHMLQHGDYCHQPLLSQMLQRYGAGRIVWIESIAGDTRALARYVTRHLIAWEHPYQPKAGRRLTYSRRFWGAGSPVDLRSALYPTEPGWHLARYPLEAE